MMLRRIASALAWQTSDAAVGFIQKMVACCMRCMLTESNGGGGVAACSVIMRLDRSRRGAVK